MVKRKRDDGISVQLRKKKKGDTQGKKKVSKKWRIYQKQLSDNFVATFRRIHGGKNDCVINAFEMLQYISAETAAIMRILRPGLTLNEDEILKILPLFYPNKSVKFKVLKENLGYSVEEFNKQHSMIRKNHAGIGYIYRIKKDLSHSGHFFVVAKDKDGKTYIIDPQVFKKEENFMGQCPNDDCTKYYKYISKEGYNFFGFVTYLREEIRK